jgi:uncharacterized protein
VTGFNNPVMAAVIEALVAGQHPQNIVALSIGTATVALPWPQANESESIYTRKRTDQSLINDLRKLATSILDDPPDIGTFVAHVMTGASDGVPNGTVSRIVRMNPLISPIGKPGQRTAPEGMTAAQFKYLANLDMDAVLPGEVAAIASYAGQWLNSKVPNQPIRMNGDTLTCELGYPWYQDAKAAWQKLFRLG